MFVWQKRASSDWLAANEAVLVQAIDESLAIIGKPGQKSLLAEVASKNRRHLEHLRNRFGGKILVWPADWLTRLARAAAAPPLTIGKRLRVTCREQKRSSNLDLVIPAGAAFGTGQHVTTAMSLRLLEQVSRRWPAGWSMIDYGTGSGILALAAKRFGARDIVGIDVDGVAISTAKQNARLNKIRGLSLQLGDAREFEERERFDVLSANLFAALLVELAPKIARPLKRGGFAVLSGILRNQESEVRGALATVGLSPKTIRRRGKWVAILAQKPI